MIRQNKAIALWSGCTPGQIDPTSHYWYLDSNNCYRRLCDDLPWPQAVVTFTDEVDAHIPCRLCDELYALELTVGRHLLDPSSAPLPPAPVVVYSPLNGGHPQGMGDASPRKVASSPKGEGGSMEIAPIPVAAFARFYKATGPQKVTMVRDARLYQSDPESYIKRDYYYDLRNTLRQTHWRTDDITTFEAALDSLIEKQKEGKGRKREYYQAIGKAYIEFWRRRDAHFFGIPTIQISLSGLPIRVAPEVGMLYHGDHLALKLWLNAPRATRGFRQAIKYMMEQAKRQSEWQRDWQAAIWDVRREEILPDVPMPRDLGRALEGQAGAFREIWKNLDSDVA